MATSARGDAKDALFDPDSLLLVEMLLADRSLACLALPAGLGREIAVLLRDSGVQRAAAHQVADVLEASVLGERCLLNLAHCQAIELVLGEFAATALPGAQRAGKLAAIVAAKHDAES